MTRGRRGVARKRFLLVPSLSILALAAAAAAPARADDTIKHPGDHPRYSVEIEPHALLGFGDVYPGGSFGLGGRFSIPIVQNGFVTSINDSVAIGLGLDVLFYGGCWYRGPCGGATYFDFPVVMQWNFFVAQRWSVFGEPGLYVYHGSFADCGLGPGCPGAPTETGVYPAFYVGGRYHLSDSISLTMRVGFPTFSFGASFFL